MHWGMWSMLIPFCEGRHSGCEDAYTQDRKRVSLHAGKPHRETLGHYPSSTVSKRLR